MPQVAASLVAARLRGADDAALGLAGQGLRDVTRLAASDPALWTSILAANAGAVRDVLVGPAHRPDGVINALGQAAAADGPETVELGALATLAQAIADGNAGVARIPGKHGRRPARTPRGGARPRRAGRAGAAAHRGGRGGVNLEDLHLEHAAGRPVGMAEISVLPAVADPLKTELRERGWRVHDL